MNPLKPVTCHLQPVTCDSFRAGNPQPITDNRNPFALRAGDGDVVAADAALLDEEGDGAAVQ